ncbi:hypothetical protein L7F22_032579 [Adiantum nelumboides]|nr:hypothetical protein [Adiantum nelumboides]
MQTGANDNGKRGFLSVVDPQLQQTGSFMPTNCSSEASTSSTVISPASLDVSEAPCESSAQSDSPALKEQDYIGMADISSISEPKQRMHQVERDLEDEPDLRLGLGPSPAKGACENAGLHLVPQHNRESSKEAPCLPHSRNGTLESAHGTFDHAHVHPHSTGADAGPLLKRLDAISIPTGFRPLAADIHSKNSKRLFSDTMAQAPSGVGSAPYANAVGGSEGVKAGTIFATGAMRMIMQQPELNSKPLTRQSQTLYWGTPRGSSWYTEVAQNVSFPSQLPRKDGDFPATTKTLLDCSPSGGVFSNNLETILDVAPPSKEQVIGWPPVRSYRRSAINSGRSRPAGTESDAVYVKVNMDGIPIGRKIDLNAYRNYDELLSALERMFYSPPVGEGVCFLHARDFVLTYEDKEGDWMLVGDVPWGMFVNTVKRLRITRGSDSTCLGSSASKNFS